MTRGNKNARLNKLKVAILGYGKMGKHHIRAIEMQDCAEVVAIVDPLLKEEDMDSILSGRLRIFSSVEELFEVLTPEVVHITTPPSTHADLAKIALENGANIYVEKPFTLEAVDAESIVSLAEDKNLNVCAGHQVLFEEPARITKDLLEEIGQVVHIESYFSFRTVRRNISPVDQLVDILPHPVYLLLNILQISASDQISEVEISSVDVKSSGEVRGIFEMGDIAGVLVVTLSGRPIESYLRIVGSNGSVYADFVRGTVTKHIGPGASTVSVVLNPFSQARQLFFKTTKSFAKLALKKQKSYPGLSELIGAFYASILNNTPPPLTPDSIVNTVRICETIAAKLKESAIETEKQAEISFREAESKILPAEVEKGTVLVTGGTGFLGHFVTTELRNNGWPVRVITRHMPFFANRVPGVEYVMADLAESIAVELLDGVEVIVHCAAETYGGKEEHERNSLGATRIIMDAAIKSGVKRLIHISSIAVIKCGSEIARPLDENTPVDLDNIGRGPYVWGKAESEKIALDLARKSNIEIRIIRLGPLVDYDAFEAPGRLGRELGPIFLAMGDRSSKLPVCRVQTASKVILSYVSDLNEAPQILNLIEPDSTTRADLTTELLKNRSDLKIIWMPFFVLKLISPCLKILQLILRPRKKPIDIQAAFASEEYNVTLSKQIIRKAYNNLKSNL